MEQQLQIDLERAATSLLTDDEIIVSLGITEQQLFDNYSIVEKTRLRLKQSLNAKRISQAANSGDAAAILGEIPRNNKGKGGARPGGGRPKGSTNKVSIIELLASIESQCGQSFPELLAQGYYESIQNSDRATRLKYEQMFINKVVADKMDVSVTETTDSITTKQQAFAEALARLTKTTQEDK